MPPLSAQSRGHAAGASRGSHRTVRLPFTAPDVFNDNGGIQHDEGHTPNHRMERGGFPFAITWKSDTMICPASGGGGAGGCLPTAHPEHYPVRVFYMPTPHVSRCYILP